MGAIAVHHTETVDGTWDGPGNVARLRSGEDAGYYARMFAWQDPEADETTKSAYKFPHHEVGEDGEPGAANVRGCQAAIGVLNGAMGGADIPDADRRGVWLHLAAHLEDAGEEPLPLRAAQGTGRETRSFADRELRVLPGDGDDGPERIVGYAAVFGSLSQELPGGRGPFVERIERGAFAETLKRADVRALFNHDPNHVLGRTAAGTLRLEEDEIGLRYEITPPQSMGWVVELIRREDVTGSSFCFDALDDEWIVENESPVRVLRKIELYDVGPVTFPAYLETTAQVRAQVARLRSGGGQGDAVGRRADDGAAGGRLGLLRRRLALLDAE